MLGPFASFGAAMQAAADLQRKARPRPQYILRLTLANDSTKYIRIP